jgi:tetratricopeptide (TPR) repeat protein
VVAQHGGTPPPAPVLLSGIIPPLADPYFRRTETGTGLSAGPVPGHTVVLTHGEETAAAPAAQGGTGKTQLAAGFAQALRAAQAVPVLVWVTATSRDAIVTGFAQAAEAVGAADPAAGAEAAAERFAAWLARTTRPWALFIDDLADPADLDGLWPAGPAGQVVITTRLPPEAFGAGSLPGGAAPRIVPLGGFSRREALSYLGSALTDHPDQRIEALDLAEDLDGLPLSLAQATAVMAARGLGCREYRAMLGKRQDHMSGVRAGGVSATVLATWSLAVECAHELAPAGLAWPTLALAAVLDPHGIPGAALTSPAACGYISGRPSTATASDQTLVRAAVTSLARAALISIDPTSEARTVLMHPSVRDAVLAWLPAADLGQVVRAAADALVQAWPEPGAGPPLPQLDQALRDCATALLAAAGGAGAPAAGAPAGSAGAESPRGAGAGPPERMLWQPEVHPLLFRCGASLDDSGLTGSAIAYWQSMAATGTRLAGPGHASTVVARDRLAAAYEAAGRFGDAIAAFASALAEAERGAGPEHPDTIAARGRLAHAYASAGRPAEAVALYERMVTDAGRQLGVGHPITLAARADLAAAYAAAARGPEALSVYRLLVTDAERFLGPGHPTTLAARADLAAAQLANGRPKDAIEQYRRVVADTEARHGPDHLDSVAARAELASALRRAGRAKEAIGAYQRVLEDRERIQGADHPDAIAARANLAFAYRSAGMLREAIPAYERTLADRERVQGSDHADTRTARSNLAAAYQQAGRLADAIMHYQQVLADSERMLGPGDPETLTARSSLAAACYADGRLMEVITMLRRALADSERYLGPDHPMTKAVRQNLDAVSSG